MRNNSRFRPREHTLKVDTVAWDTRNALFSDRCPYDQIQDEAHALLVCREADVCALRRKHYLFHCFSGDSSMEQPYLQQVSVWAVFDYLLQHNNKLVSFLSSSWTFWLLNTYLIAILASMGLYINVAWHLSLLQLNCPRRQAASLLLLTIENTSHSQVLEPGAPNNPPDPH
eukprot:1144937-Pelagomonas_calceolata.AAC.3